MDIKNGIDYRYKRYTLYNKTGNMKYDYETEGILNKCLPKILFKGNGLLVSFIQLIDRRIILMFKYIDRLKQFKWVANK